PAAGIRPERDRATAVPADRPQHRAARPGIRVPRGADAAGPVRVPARAQPDAAVPAAGGPPGSAAAPAGPAGSTGPTGPAGPAARAASPAAAERRPPQLREPSRGASHPAVLRLAARHL